MTIVLLSFLFEGLMCYTFGLNSATDDAGLSVSILLLTINSIILFVYIVRRYRDYDIIVSYVMVISLLLKVALLLWDYYGTSIFILPNSHLDSEGFHNGAILFAKHQSTRVENYSYVIGCLYRLFGVQRITAQFSNVILSFVGIDLLERMLVLLEIDDNARKITLFFAALLPNYLIISAILIRECLISVILCISLYMFVKWWKHGGAFNCIISLIVPLAASYFHSGAIALTIGITI